MPALVKNELDTTTGVFVRTFDTKWDTPNYNSCDTLDVIKSLYVVIICSWMDISPNGVFKNPSLVVFQQSDLTFVR